MVKAVIFDIDETLINHYKAIEKALCIFHEKKSLSEKVTIPELVKYWNEAERKFFELYLQGKMTILEQRIARIQHVYRGFGVRLNEIEAKNTIEEYLCHYRDSWELFDDVVDCLNSLKEYKLGIISNGDPVQQRMKLEKTGIEHYFSVVLISGDINIPKPHKEIFMEALNRLGVKPEEAIYIGDDPVKDIHGSSGAGIYPILIDRYDKNRSAVHQSIRVVGDFKNFTVTTDYTD